MKRSLLGFTLALGLFCHASAQVPQGLHGTWAGAAMTAETPRLFSLEIEVAGGQMTTYLTQPYNGFDRFQIDLAYAPASEPGAFGTLTTNLFGDEMRLLVDLDERTLRGVVVDDDSVTQTVFLQQVPSFPLPAIAEREVRIRSGRDTLAGSLILPDAPAYRGGPHPAVVMVTGRGYGTREQMGALGRLYARTGITTVIWDGRGQGRSTGDAATVTSAERIADVQAVLDWVATQPEIDGAQVGVQGNSAGGWIGPLAADGRPDVAFMITTVGPAEGLADQQGHTTTSLMRDADDTFTEAEFASASADQHSFVDMAQRGASWAEYEAINAPARAARWAEHALIPDSLGLPDLDFYARMPGLDAGPALARWQRPLLALFGEADWVVPPEHNVPLLRRLTASNPDVTIAVLPMGHALERPAAMVGEGAWPDRYRRVWTRVPESFETLLGWLDAQTTTAAER